MCNCISFDCKKFQECGRASINAPKADNSVTWGSFGSGIVNSDEIRVEHFCGDEGDYKMFIPIDSIESF